MEKDLQLKVQGIIYAVFIVIISVVLIRILLKLVGADQNNEIISFFYDFSNVFVSPWEGIFRNLKSQNKILEVFSLIAAFFYLVLSFIFARLAGILLINDSKEFTIKIIDFFFKIAEITVFSRFILKLVGADTDSTFILNLYKFTDFTYKPVETILPAIESNKVTLEVSTLIFLILIIILDYLSELILIKVLNQKQVDKKSKLNKLFGLGLFRSSNKENVIVYHPKLPIIKRPYLYDNLYKNNSRIPPKRIDEPAQIRGFLLNSSPRSSRQGGQGYN